MNMRLRLTLAFVLVVLVAILSLVVFVRLDTARQVRQFVFRGGMVGAESLVGQLENYYQTNSSWQGVGLALPSESMGPGLGRARGAAMMQQRIQLTDRSGRMLYDSDHNALPNTLLPQERLDRAIPLQDQQGQTVGYLLVNQGETPTAADVLPLLQRLNGAAFRAAVLAGLLGLGLALLVTNQFLKPVGQLTRAAERMTAGDLAQRVPVRGSDELATLASTFNSMAESLQKSEERRQAMTADIAHELRNPLSVQRAYLEALQDGIYPLTPENLQPVFDQNILLSRLVEDLRTLALADAGELKLEKTEVDVNNLAACLLERFKLLAQNRRIRIEMDLEKAASQSPKVWGDPLRLEQILNNLMSNALRYTPEGGSIVVEISQMQDRVEIGVHDSGPGIPPEALPHVFERFYRADRSRSRDEGGSGLGLAIARQLALAHEGELKAANDPGGGALFILRLPRLIHEKGLAAE